MTALSKSGDRATAAYNELAAADIDALMFPRIAAAAEAAWSPATGEHPLRSWESFRERVGALDGLWSALGIRFRRSPEIPWSGEGAS